MNSSTNLSGYEIVNVGGVELMLLKPMLSKVAFSDFCAPAGTIEFVAKNGLLNNENLTLFRIRCEGYDLEAIVDAGRVFVRRNGLYQHSDCYLGRDDCRVAIQWGVGAIAVGINVGGLYGEMDGCMRGVRTPLTSPPADLISKLRKHGFLPEESYPTASHLFATLLDCIHLAELDIRRHGSEKLVWGKGGDRSAPKDEPDISKLLAVPLTAHCAPRGMDVTCESHAGSGRIDFYVVGHVENVGLVRVAMEAKKADSANLVHGFTKQLPEYMSRLSTSFGVFIVYWLKSKAYPYPAENAYHELEHNVLHRLPRLGTVRTVGVDLSYGDPPSR